jgi:hypothetical protein
LNIILEKVAIKSKKVNKNSTAFSAVKWVDVKNILGYVDYEQYTKEVPATMLDQLHSQLLKIGVVFGSVSSGKEAKRLQFISPILLEVCALFEGRVKITVEEDLEGVNIRTNGHFEYVLEVDGRKLCIVEAKKTDMEQGMAQALLGNETIADLDNVSEVYSIVTNFREWYFLKNTDDAIYRDVYTLLIEHDIPTKASVGEIAGKIYGMLSSV